MRENRIKEESFSAFSVAGSVITSKFLDHPINGEVLKLQFRNITSPGSIWISESGTNIEVFRKNDFTSGTANIEIYPAVYSNIGSPYQQERLVTNNVLVMAGSGFTSGTAKTFGPITVFYR